MTAFWKRGSKPPNRDRREAWQAAAHSLGGTFVQGKRPSRDRVTVEHDVWIVELDTYTVHTGQTSVTYTRARAFFVGQDDAKLRIRRRNFFDTILENIGLGGVEVGNREFGERYVVKGRPEARLRSALSAGLVAALLVEPPLTVAVKKASRKHRKLHGPLAREAAVYKTGAITDPDRLVGMITIAKETLSGLEVAGMARRESVVGVGT